MLGEKEGIEGVLNEYITRSAVARQECEVFGKDFGRFMDHIAIAKQSGGFNGLIPAEVIDPPVDADVFTKMLSDCDRGVFEIGPQNSASPAPIPVPVIWDGKFSLKILAYDKNAQASIVPLKEGISATRAMLKYLHASAERPSQYPHVYEFIKAFALAFSKDSKPHVNQVKLGAFLDAIPCELSEELLSEAYKAAFREGKTRTIINGLLGIKEGVTGDNFRDWLSSFKPKKHEARFIESLRAIVDEKITAAIFKAKSLFLTRVADSNSVSQMARPNLSLHLHKPTFLKQYDESASIRGVMSKVAESAQNQIKPYRPEEAVKVSRVINIGATSESSRQFELAEEQKKEALKLLDLLAKKMIFFGRGMKFSFCHFSSICELIFGDTIDWAKPKKISWETLFNESGVEIFKDMDKGKDEDLYFLDEVYQIRVLLEKKGLRNTVVRELFIKELPRKISTNE
jgi:hypothetical protein